MKKILSFIKDHKKELLIAAGVTCVAVAGLSTIKAVKTTKEAVKNHQEMKQVIQEAIDLNTTEYTDEDAANDTFINNVQTTIKIVKAFVIPSLFICSAIVVGFLYKKHNFNSALLDDKNNVKEEF